MHRRSAALSRPIGGHATLIRAPAAVRASVDVFAPEQPALRALAKRVKESFDPKASSIPAACGRVSDHANHRSLSHSLQDPQFASSEKILRACVHCGFCTATCPTYVLLGDELDSPRGRIYLIKEMLEQDRPATREVVKHIDRCLSCLACMTTCPSGVHYMHLVDHARDHIEQTYKRPHDGSRCCAACSRACSRSRTLPARRRAWTDRAAAGAGVRRAGSDAGWGRCCAWRRAASRRRRSIASARSIRRRAGAAGASRFCPAASIRCSRPRPSRPRSACSIATASRSWSPPAKACCGSLVHHMGREDEALAQARNNIDAWTREIEGAGLDAILVTVSGCGTTIKDYGFMLRNDPAYADKAARVSARARDISEYLATLKLADARAPVPLTVAYHAACSLQHGQKVLREPKDLLTEAGSW